MCLAWPGKLTFCFAVLLPITSAEVTVLTPRQSGSEGNTQVKLLSAYGYSAAGQSSLEFQVKACQDASVALMTTDDEDASGKIYMVTLGGYVNTKIVIYDSKYGSEKTKMSGTVLGCNAFNYFKVKWSSGHVSVFSSPDSGVTWTELALWIDPSPIAVNYIGVTTSIYSDGEWKIKIGGETTSIETTTTTIPITTPAETTTTTTTSMKTTAEVTFSTTTSLTTTAEATTTTAITTEMVTTTYTSTMASGVCPCVCIKLNTTSFDCALNDVSCVIEAVKKELTVDKQILSSTIRKKTSANDDRPSAQAIGMVGVAFLVAFVLIVFVPDFVILCRYLFQRQSKAHIP
ncbi:mucin-22-like [Argopecten irradians]|uniref:mucin-22-like n=1 Tax=Argopecten irradians TaxID=31199 RepID=UPI00371353DD